MALWRFRSPLLALSSAPYGGGWGERRWVLAAQVTGGYRRADPAGHPAGLARQLDLDRPGGGIPTAVDWRPVAISPQDRGAAPAARVGATPPAWAAAPDAGAAPATGGASAAGTVNIIAVLSRRLSPAALVNAVMTVTEAKSQAMWEAGIAGTGTPSDAVAVLCPPS